MIMILLLSYQIISSETPDSVSILHVNNLTSVVEDREFQLRCDITNVAPARNLAVLWYHGNEILEPHIRGLFSHKFYFFWK